MEELKKTRVAAAITVNVIILAVILVAVLVYQLVNIIGMSRQRDRLKQEISSMQQQIENKEKDLEYLQSEDYMLKLAFQLGYYFPKK